MNIHALSGKRLYNMSQDLWFDPACNNQNQTSCLPKTPVNRPLVASLLKRELHLGHNMTLEFFQSTTIQKVNQLLLSHRISPFIFSANWDSVMTSLSALGLQQPPPPDIQQHHHLLQQIGFDNTYDGFDKIAVSNFSIHCINSLHRININLHLRL